MRSVFIDPPKHAGDRLNLFLLLTALFGALIGTGRTADVRAPTAMARGVDGANFTPMRDAAARAISLAAAAPDTMRPNGYFAAEPLALSPVDGLAPFALRPAPERRRE